ncbi:MAG: NAD(P)/FAD-dependent oxidoreductase [Dorea sp.]
MIQISQLKLQIPHTEEKLREKVLKLLRIRENDLISFRILKKSLDARKKPQLFYVYTVEVRVKNENHLKKTLKNGTISFHPEKEGYRCEPSGTKELSNRPVIIGTGPAGLFCGYQLALMGYRPILLERGADVDERIQDVEKFWNGGTLKENSNVQFGEGGAGTFSDGKLNTLVNDKFGRNQEVLRIFTKYGAPERIQYESKPHIGTDVLAKVVKNLRNAIIESGGEVHFHSQVTDFQFETKNNKKQLKSLTVYNHKTNQTKTYAADLAVLAVGHSARDTFEMLFEHNVPMEAKPFAVGVRMEHPQSMINKSQYGTECSHNLPAAPYKLAVNLENGRGVYTFCMCPGGYVVNASSEDNRCAVNGMSYSGRDGVNANTAVIVTVTPEDYGQAGILSGMEFQRNLEERAYKEGNGNIPVQQFGDFCANVPSSGPGEIIPQIKGQYTWANVRNIFPEYIANALEEGILQFDRKINGYARKDAVVSGVESRTSSPVRILRSETLQSEIAGLYPCGEGAGYAGGITSAAMDGLKVAEAVSHVYRPFDIMKRA